MSDAASIASRMLSGQVLLDEPLILDLGGLRIGVRSGSRDLLNRLSDYFSHVRSTGVAEVEVLAIESPPADLGLAFTDWSREPGKVGRKEAVHDLDDGRVIHKVRTGVIFLQSVSHRIAIGPCLENANQIINFIINQQMNWLLDRGGLICHASGVVVRGGCIGVAAFSGGGKSSLMLHLLGEPEVNYLTNDRLILMAGKGGPTAAVDAVGVAKMPRVNPGTITSIHTLRSILGEARCAEFEALPPDKLWSLEEKYDVDVEQRFGIGKITPMAPLRALLILNWEREATAPCELSRVDLGERGDLLPAVMKLPGPFYQLVDGGFQQDQHELDPASYLRKLEGVEIWEARGRVDFNFAAKQCLSIANSEKSKSQP